MYDLVIRDGLVADGSGQPAFQADVALNGDKIAAIGKVTEKGRQEIDAEGLVVSPGFIDLHTHYDAQYTWDPYATSSIWHGVTTTIIGNCGFAIAPCKPEHRETAMRTLVHVEGMSFNAMSQGIQWDFETFPEYLAALDAARPALNIGAFVGHSALRLWVMGESAQHRAATEAEVAQMADMTRQAMAAGAIGLGTSTAEAHNGVGGLPVASRLAEFSEMRALAVAMGESGKGIFQITTGGGTSLEQLREISQQSGRPLCWAAFFHRDDNPQATTVRLAQTEKFRAEGMEIVPQVSCRPLTMDFTLHYPYPFEGIPAWKQVMARPQAEWDQVYREESFRNALKDDLANQRYSVFRGRWDLVQVLKGNSTKAQACVGHNIGELAAELRRDPVDVMLDLALEDDLQTEFVAGLMNIDEEAVGKLISHPDTVISLSDAGAHISLLCDAGYTSTLLGKWVREKGVMSMEEAVRRVTSAPARLYRIPKRGLLREGYFADLAVFDPATIHAKPNEWAHDLPGGEARFIARAEGVHHSIVNGVPVLRNGEVLEMEAARRPGTMLRDYDS